MSVDSDDEFENETQRSSWWIVWLLLIVVAMVVLVIMMMTILTQPQKRVAKRVTWSDGWTAAEID